MAQNARIADPEMQLKKGRYVVKAEVFIDHIPQDKGAVLNC
jgi:hypothetical protein